MDWVGVWRGGELESRIAGDVGRSGVQGHLEETAQQGGEALVGADADDEVLGDQGAGGAVQALGEDVEFGALLVDGAGGLVAEQPRPGQVGGLMGGAKPGHGGVVACPGAACIMSRRNPQAAVQVVVAS